MNLKEILMNKMVLDAFQYYNSCDYKLNSAQVSFEGLKKLVNEYFENNNDEYEHMINELTENNEYTYTAKEDLIDFFGVEIPRIVALDKLTMEITSLLHSFFDTFSQWINTALLGEDAYNVDEVTLNKVINKISSYPEYNGDFINDFKNIMNNDLYKFVSDFNNIQKHRYQLFTQSSFKIFERKNSFIFPKFKKGNRKYTNKDVIQTLDNIINYATILLNDSKNYIEQYYSSNDCRYVNNRFYNPKTYLQFDSEDDFNHLRNAKFGYHYIEVDSNAVLDKVYIMLYSYSDDIIEEYNSIYDLIVVRNKENERILGLLKPVDSDSYTLKDEHHLIYREYKFISSNYMQDIINYFNSGKFYYYPLLSECKIVYPVNSEVNANESC